MTLTRPLPPGAYVSEEGWIVVGDEAYTEAEWEAQAGQRKPDLLALPDQRVDRRTYRREWKRIRRRDPAFRQRENAIEYARRRRRAAQRAEET